MKKHISTIVAMALATTMIVGCSDSDSDDTKASVDAGFVGKFVDRSVDGVTFACTGTDDQPLVGITQNDGEFGVCKTGATVTFSLGNIVLGSATQTDNNIFTPSDIAADEDEANKIASLVLSLSVSETDENGVEVFVIKPETVLTLNNEVNGTTNISDVNQSVVDETIVAVTTTDEDLNPVSSEDAAEHLEESERQIADGEITTPEQPEEPATTGSTGGN